MIGLGVGLGLDKGRSGYDPAAANFFARAAITNNTQKTAVNNLVKGLKADGLWTKLLGFYPFVGGTAAAHSQNLKSALYPITWVNGPTHNANGITGNGTTQCGIITGTENVLPAFGHLSCYVRVAATTLGDYRDYIGMGNEGASLRYYLVQAEGAVPYVLHGYWGQSVSTADASQGTAWIGLLSTHRRTTTDLAVFQNGVLKDTDVTLETNAMPTTLPIAVLARIDQFPANAIEHADANLASASFGSSMTNPEVLNFYTRVQAYQTALARQV